MISFSIRQIEAFLWVASLNSFRQAAEKLNTTQPAISNRISTLENQLALKLFDRDAGQIRLTPSGHQLLPQARRFLALAEEMALADRDDQQSGLIRLGVAETIVHTWLPEFLKTLRTRLPMIDVDVLVDVTLNLRNELTAHRLDLAFLMGPVSEYRIGNLDLPSFPLTWVASPELGLPDDRPLSLEEISAFPIITYARTTRPYAEIWRKLSEPTARAPRIFPVSSLAASLRMTLDNVGIAALPADLVQEPVAEKKLRALDCEWVPNELNFTASWAADPPNLLAERIARLAKEVADNHAARQRGG
ncbi:MAG: LysR family transcriptional regulator [Pseudomonadota bacterium]